MVCDIGYRQTARIRVPTPQPMEMRQRDNAPEVDADLLEKLGGADPEFVEWLGGIDITPLLAEAMAKAIDAVGGEAMLINFSLTESGELEATKTYNDPGELARAEQAALAVARRWQAEILSMVAQLMDYETVISAEDGTVVVTGLKADGKTEQMLRVQLGGADARIVFEHFASKATLQEEWVRFMALAQKLGIPLILGSINEGGTPVPTDMTLTEFQRLHEGGG